MAAVDLPVNNTSHGPAPRLLSRRRAATVALLLWIAPMAVIAALVIKDPLRHTVTMDSFHHAARNWWAGQSLYIGPSGMNYLPHFAILYSPFHFLPLRLSEVLWRLCAAATLAAGLWCLTRELFGRECERAFLWATVLAMPLCLGSLRNGNANAIFGGVTILAIAATLRQRWWLAVGWMILATALKPLGIVLLLLAAIYYAPVARRLPAALFGLALFPFFFGAPGYVWGQYQEAWRDLGACAAVSQHRFADINGILRTIGVPLSTRVSTMLRFLCGGLTAIAWLWGARRLNPSLRCLWLYALATAYLMLFNPMTEANSYVILAPTLGVWAVCFLFKDELGGRKLGWVIVVMALCMGLLPTILRPVFGDYFALIWHPLMTILFLAALVIFISRTDLGKLCPQPAPNP